MENNPLKVSTKVFIVSYLNDGRVKTPTICTSVTKCVNKVFDIIDDIDECSADRHLLSGDIRRNIAHSFTDEGKPFSMVIHDKNKKKHVFRVDKDYVNVGVKIL